MAYGITRWHTQWLAHYAYHDAVTRPPEASVLVYDDEADDVQDDDDIGTIESEPEGDGYARQPALFVEGGTVEPDQLYTAFDMGEVTFDLGDSSREIDSWAVVWDVMFPGETEPSTRLMVRGPLARRVDTSVVGTFDVPVAWQIHSLF